MKQPLTAKRLAANRANADRSTGPRTPEGKARSAQNARKHSFHPDRFAVVALENPEIIANLRADAIAAYQPVNSQELFAVERIVLAQQSMLRMSALEAGLFTNCLDTAMVGPAQPCVLAPSDLTEGIPISPKQHGSYWFGFGFHRFGRQANTLALFLRYQAQAERLYRRAVEEFERLKALRGELPNEPISPAEPQETEPVTAPETNPSPLPQPAPVPPPAPPDPIETPPAVPTCPIPRKNGPR